ncbi:MAG: DEAD/DEAH box helicase [Burkholderiaceae bacterium]|nr:DEAD/DEAH box helicase [Burkholderiaceae bacterium]
MSDYQDFLHFGLAPEIVSAIQTLGYEKPTPIQSKAIPIVLQGKDVMGAAQTGTGKTAGFGLPMLQKIINKQTRSVSPARHPLRALVLAPTRELAEQVAGNIKGYASKSLLRVASVYGGVDIRPQGDVLRQGVEVLIATPGRLLDHLEQKNISLSQVEILVLDEADRMLDMGFLPDISRIVQQIPASSQNLMFSATFSPEIKKLAKNFLKDPIMVEVARQNATASTIQQELFLVRESEKTDTLLELLRDRCEDVGKVHQVIVFVNAKITARRLARQLERFGVSADSIHGDKTQEERLKTLQDFKDCKVNVLVATDVAARGLDIAELPVVINYDVPFNAEDYVHRIGRTGRAGSKGLALTIMTGSEERNVEAIELLTRQKFDRTVFNPETAPRYERRERKNRHIFRKSPDAYSVSVRKATEDPFFSQPYIPSHSGETEAYRADWDVKREPSKSPVAALLRPLPKKATQN